MYFSIIDIYLKNIAVAFLIMADTIQLSTRIQNALQYATYKPLYNHTVNEKRDIYESN